MQSPGRQPETQVFVVRFLREEPGNWRGQVEHVPSGRRQPVTDLGQLQALIYEYLGGEPGPDGPSTAPTGEAAESL